MTWGARCLLLIVLVVAVTSPNAECSRLAGASTRRLPITKPGCPLSVDSNLAYWGGPILADGINVYVILYGNWSTSNNSCAPTVFKGLLDSIANASLAASKNPTVYSWWKVVTKYCNGKGRSITQQVKATFVYDNYSQGKTLVPAMTPQHTYQTPGVWKVVQYNLNKGKLKLDPKGVYLVLSSGDVKVGHEFDLCDGCMFHNYNTYNNTNVVYGWVAEPTVDPACDFCINNLAKTGPGGKPYSPNGCYPADSMATNILAVIANAATDPFYTAWDSINYRQGAHEVATICRSFPGLTWDAKKTYQYNLQGSGSLRFLVAAVYDPVKATCVLQP